MKKHFALVLFLWITTVSTESPKSDSTVLVVLKSLRCPKDPQPWECGRTQAGRLLDIWEDAVDEVKNKIMLEADAEIARRSAGRSIGDGPVDVPKPSVLMRTIDNYVANSIEKITSRKKGDKDKKKKKKKKKKGGHKDKPEEHDSDVTIHYQVEGIESELEDIDLDTGHDIGGFGNKFGHKMKKGRSIGVGRKKKFKHKKKKKALMKLLLVGAIIKGKIELLLKLLSAHLQIKFFAIALIGLLINLARFYIDLKKGHSPQKVIYYEHAQHQHHYDEHGDDWGGGGGYWKRSIKPEENPENRQGIIKREEELEDDYRRSFQDSGDYSANLFNLNAHRLAYSHQIPSQ